MSPLKACGWILDWKGRTLLLRNALRQEWGLPKGHAEPGETEMQTALRELHEETGMTKDNLAIDPDFRIVETYGVWTKPGFRREKSCVYFRARCRRSEVTLSPEHDEHRWATAPDIVRSVKHPQLRKAILGAR
ncbi:MAG: NUDIX domain-containing protein [Planctomycetota bacterium]